MWEVEGGRGKRVRQTDRPRGRGRGGQTHRQRGRGRDSQTHTHTHIHTDSHTQTRTKVGRSQQGRGKQASNEHVPIWWRRASSCDMCCGPPCDSPLPSELRLLSNALAPSGCCGPPASLAANSRATCSSAEATRRWPWGGRREEKRLEERVVALDVAWRCMESKVWLLLWITGHLQMQLAPNS